MSRSVSDWWRGAVLYQIYPRSFRDANGDGIGDLAGIVEKLDHLAWLGVDAIWISPFFPSPMKDFGYDVSDYLGVDPIFGTLDDFERVTREAHARGLKVMIDQVWSHTSDEHPWFQESRQSRDNAKADWFVWADPAPDGTAPNNWLSVFGGGAWSWDPRRCQYYLHHFLSCQPQLNLRNDEVLAALLDSARIWIERGVDGFRFDAVDFMLHDAQLRSNPARPSPDGKIPSKPFGLQAHLYDMVQPDTGALIERLRDFTDQFPGVATLGEVSSQDGALARIENYTGAGGTRLHMAYTLATMKRRFDKAAFVDAIEDAQADLHSGWLCLAFSNHDVDRAVSRWLPDGAQAHQHQFVRLLLALLLTLRGSVCMYQGEELGLPHYDVPVEQMRDPYGLAFWPAFAGRDGARTPMPWAEHAMRAGFGAGADPWLPIPPSHRALAVDRQRADPASHLHAWQKFLAWRRTMPALCTGSITLEEAPDTVLAYTREQDGQRVLCVFNLSIEEASFPIGDAKQLDAPGITGVVDGDHVRLPPFGVWLGS
ncbi:alpha-glucosidase [Roseiterribacter gracilis]|uniref:Alpha-glucosidase n=1 Tax=Roseiterribacter gracilis TaxID=2812848 RepID=A0A8S8XGW7_9PROT|nr:alpha-glucosidase [Rhodospirillales bacterium TMPK1]